MHALSLLLLAAGSVIAQVNATAAQANPATVATKAFVQFPASMLSNQWTTDRNKINGYIHVARDKCLQLCGHEIGVGNYCHHQINVTPMRMANVAETTCWCCVKDPKGDCYSASKPYNATQPWGPWVDMTTNLMAKLANKAIGCSTVTAKDVSAVAPVVLQVTTPNPAPGQTITFHWEGPQSQIGGTYYAYFIDQKKNVVVRSLSNNACKFPSMTGKISITLSAAKDPAAPSLYIVARTTLNIGTTASKRLKRTIRGMHGAKHAI